MYLGFVIIISYILFLAYAAKTKKKALILPAILILAVLMYFLAPLRSTKVEGNSVRVENKFGGYATFAKSETEEAEVYLLLGKVTIPYAISGYSADLPVLPLGTVEKLNQQFGDFRKCTSPGAATAMSAMIELRLIGADRKTLSQIVDAYTNAMATNKDFFLKVRGHSLQMLENEMQGRIQDRPLSAFPPRKDVLVADLEFFSK